MSIQDIQQNPQDTSNFYLAGIYQSVIDPNRSDILSSLPASPPPFSPPTYAIWVNSLWFLSLVISITCALLATLLQQWARRYLRVTQTRSTLHKRARIRSFFAEGVKSSHFAWVVEALPTLIHLSLSLFFAGLAVFLWNVNLTIFKVILSWISVCTVLYGCITLIPIFRHDSPYYSPLTLLAWSVVTVISLAFLVLYAFFYLFVLLLSHGFRCRRPIRIFGHLLGWLLEAQDMVQMTPEVAALKSSLESDARALMWTFDSLDEDHELDRFFSGMPGFHNSKVLKEPLRGLDDQQKLKLLEAVIRLLDRTFSSNLLSDHVKLRRADTCDNAMKLVDTPKAFPKIIRRLASEDGYGPLQSTRVVDFVRRCGNGRGEYSTQDQAIFSIVVARVQQRDDSWFSLASEQLSTPETVLRSHAAHGDSLSLAILIYVTRQQLSHFWDSSWPLNAISDILRAASKFNVEDTSAELQHEFCAIWNQVVRKMKDVDNWKIAERILKPIRHVYIRLHHDTNSAPTQFSASTSDSNDILDDTGSYPLCCVTGHGHGGSASITFPLPVLSNDAAPPSAVPLTSPSAPSLPVPAPSHVDESVTTPPSLDISHPTPETVDNFPVPVTSPDPAPAGVVREIAAAGITIPLPSPETSFSTSISPLSFASPPPDLSIQHNANLLVSSYPPNLSSLASSDTVPSYMLHTGPSLFSHWLMTRSDLSPYCPAITATTALSASQGVIPATDPGAIPEGHVSSMPGSSKALDPQSPSLPSVTDTDGGITGNSLREPNRGDRLHHSRGLDDMV